MNNWIIGTQRDLEYKYFGLTFLKFNIFYIFVNLNLL